MPEKMQAHPLCMLFPGTAWGERSSTRDSLLMARERYIDQLREEGKLGAAGTTEPPDDLVGLVIFKPIPLDEAQHLQEGPAVQEGVLRVEYHSWSSSDHVLPW